MSGIVGTYYIDGRPVEPTMMTNMVDRLAHRGPDGADIWTSGNVGLGHRMLWTTPESLTEQLPLQRGALTITADARIDNRDELIVALELESHASKPLADSEIILAAYEKWGERCPEKLLGDFAFAIWDGRNQILFCARDYFGARPFYYHYGPRKLFTFSSEIKGLFCLPQVPQRLNEVRVGDHLASLLNDKAITFYQDIFRLPPAHRLIVSPNRFLIEPFWSLDPNRELEPASATEYAEAYLDIFSKAVKCRLRSAYPIGSALSGGLDSSSIVGVAQAELAQQNRDPLHTFSAVFDDVPESDERPYIQAVIDRGGVQPHFVRADRLNPLTQIEKMLWHQDEPFATPNLFMHCGLYSAAQQQGVRVFLDGYMGDNVVCHGWEYLIDLAQADQYYPLIKQLYGIAKRQPGYSFPSLLKSYLWELSLKQKIPNILKKAWRRSRRQTSPVTPEDNYALINPSFVERISLPSRLRADKYKPLPYLSVSKNRRFRDLLSGDMPLALEIASKAGMSFAIEPTFPFADRRLAEFCLALPSDQRIQDGRSRMIVRRALHNHLPSNVCWRSDKGNLGYNFCHTLITQKHIDLQAIFSDESGQLEPYIDLSRLRSTKKDFNYEKLSEKNLALWQIIVLSLWLGYQQNEQPALSPRLQIGYVQ
ncbi:MAG: lasso peptide isopeptide bond-forming cyclase [Cyanobacteria bacterium P01_D01_bin.156]